MRIVTLLPAATEMVTLLGLESQLVGRSHECDFPKSITNRPIVTRPLINDTLSSQEIDALVKQYTESGLPLFEINQATLHSIQPDLIITQKLCDVCAISPAQVDEAIAGMQHRPQVLRLGAATLNDVFEDLLLIGKIAKCRERADASVETLRDRVDFATVESPKRRRRVVFLEWLNPAFTAGHWNPELIERAGGRNEVQVEAGQKSIVLSKEELGRCNPELIFIAACGFSAERAEHEWNMLAKDDPVRQLHHRSGAKLVFADGNAFFNRPGPRLVESLEILADAVRTLET